MADIQWHCPIRVDMVPFDGLPTDRRTVAMINGRYYCIGELASHILHRLTAEPRSENQLAAEFIGEGPEANATLRKLLSQLAYVGLVAPISEHEGATELASSTIPPKRSYALFAFDIVPATVVYRASHLLESVYKGKRLLWIVPVLLSIHGMALWFIRPAISLSQLLPHSQFLAFFALLYLGLLLHEIGHAAACSASGVQPGRMGIMIYMLSLAFYVDVSASWTASRIDRIRIGAGGLVASLLTACICSLVYVATGDLLWKELMLCNDFVLLLNSIPFVRLDGYWILSDILGIHNMMQLNRQSLVWIARRLRHPSVGPPPFSLAGYPRSHRIAYRVYLVGFVMWIVAAVGRLCTYVIPKSITGVMRSSRALHEAVADHLGYVYIAHKLLIVTLSALPILYLVLYGTRYLTDLWKNNLSAPRTQS